jgi:hypothetical protein
MMTVPVQVWVAALEESAVEVANVALGFERCDVIGKESFTPLDVAGAYLPLFGGSGQSIYIGWLATPEARKALARGLLAFAPNDAISDEDVADAMGEVVNILAGGLKRRMLQTIQPLSLGLPMFSATPMTPIHSTTHATLVRCGDVESHLVLVTGYRASAQS